MLDLQNLSLSCVCLHIHNKYYVLCTSVLLSKSLYSFGAIQMHIVSCKISIVLIWKDKKLFLLHNCVAQGWKYSSINPLGAPLSLKGESIDRFMSYGVLSVVINKGMYDPRNVYFFYIWPLTVNYGLGTPLKCIISWLHPGLNYLTSWVFLFCFFRLDRKTPHSCGSEKG